MAWRMTGMVSITENEGNARLTTALPKVHIALMGIEIKNSILLVDFTDQLRAEGLDLDTAVRRAGEIRFLPIVLTTATAIGGLLPLALAGSSLYSPLAVVLVGGLVSSTLLARLVTPAAYKLLAPPVRGSAAPAVAVEV